MTNISENTRIIAGTMTWGSWGKRLSKSAMIDLMQYCFSIGITTFDHADIYGGYSTEEEFGAAFKESGISRDSICLISKCGIQMPSYNRTTKLKHYNYSEHHIITSVEQSLENLKTDYLDFLLLHRPSPLMDPKEIGSAIKKLKKSGKIKSVGVSNFTRSQIKMFNAYMPLEANQIEFSLTQHSAMYNGILDDCIENSRLAMAWSPLGIYFKEDNKTTKRIKSVLNILAKKYQVSENQLLLAWLLRHPAHIKPVVGTTSKERLQESLEAIKIELDLEDWFLLLEASRGHEVE
ncbi:aldo/keto reductase [Aurantibacter sp.]|uniref:aldo/keto reductase n=1 Tax=Aurantibacter sp. TaxID=2807103 RepID=UPI003265F8B8